MPANGTWIGDAEYHVTYSDTDNWLNGQVCSNSSPTATVVLTLDLADASYTPENDTGQPAVNKFDVVVNGLGSLGNQINLNYWLETDAEVRNVTLATGGGSVTCGSAITGNLSVSAGYAYYQVYGVSGTTTIVGGGVTIDTGDFIFEGAVSVSAGGFLGASSSAYDATFYEAVTLATAGMFDLPLATLAAEGLTGSGCVGSGNQIVITGSVALTSGTWSVGADSVIYDTGDLPFDPGTSSPIANLGYQNDYPASLARNIAIDNFYIKGDLDGNGKTVTLSGATYGFVWNDGELTNTLNVVVSEAGWEINTSSPTGILNITVPLGVTCPGSTLGLAGAGIIRPNLNVIGTLEVVGTAACYINSITGSGTLKVNGQHLEIRRPIAGDFFSLDTAVQVASGKVFTLAYLDASRSNTHPVLVDPASGTTHVNAAGVYTLTLNGGLSCGVLTVGSRAVLAMGNASVLNTNGKSVVLGNTSNTGTLNLAPGSVGNSLGAITLGAGTKNGVLVLAGSTGIGALAKDGSSAANAVTYGGTVAVAGDQTLASLVTTFGAASLVMASGKTVLGLNAVTPTSAGAHAHGGAVTNLALTAANPLYRFGDTSSDSGNGVGVIKCPAPASPSCMPMAA